MTPTTISSPTVDGAPGNIARVPSIDGPLARFGVPSSIGRVIPLGPSQMDAETILERQREGGGSPTERRRAGRRSRWSLVAAALGAYWPFRDHSARGDGVSPLQPRSSMTN